MFLSPKDLYPTASHTRRVSNSSLANYARDFGCGLSLRSRPQNASIWSGRRESNPRPTAWKAVTLPLSYSRPAHCCFKSEVLRYAQDLARRLPLRSRLLNGSTWKAVTLPLSYSRPAHCCFKSEVLRYAQDPASRLPLRSRLLNGSTWKVTPTELLPRKPSCQLAAPSPFGSGQAKNSSQLTLSG